MTAHISVWISHYGSLAIFLLMTLESACIPIPSEAVVPYGGFLASHGDFSLTNVVIVSTLANLVGGYIAYFVGRTGGRAFILHYGRYVLLHEKHLSRAERWFQSRGEITVLLCRMLPAVRTFISLPAGMAKMGLGKFTLFSLMGSVIWNFALAYAGFALGSNWETVGHYLKPLSYVFAVILVVVVLWFWLGKRKGTRQST